MAEDMGSNTLVASAATLPELVASLAARIGTMPNVPELRSLIQDMGIRMQGSLQTIVEVQVKRTLEERYLPTVQELVAKSMAADKAAVEKGLQKLQHEGDQWLKERLKPLEAKLSGLEERMATTRAELQASQADAVKAFKDQFARLQKNCSTKKECLNLWEEARQVRGRLALDFRRQCNKLSNQSTELLKLSEETRQTMDKLETALACCKPPKERFAEFRSQALQRSALRLVGCVFLSWHEETKARPAPAGNESLSLFERPDFGRSTCVSKLLEAWKVLRDVLPGLQQRRNGRALCFQARLCRGGADGMVALLYFRVWLAAKAQRTRAEDQPSSAAAWLNASAPAASEDRSTGNTAGGASGSRGPAGPPPKHGSGGSGAPIAPRPPAPQPKPPPVARAPPPAVNAAAAAPQGSPAVMEEPNDPNDINVIMETLQRRQEERDRQWSDQGRWRHQNSRGWNSWNRKSQGRGWW